MGFNINALLILLMKNNAASACGWNVHGDLLRIDGNNVTRIGHESLGLNTVYGSELVDSGSHDWSIKMHQVTSGTIRIGISSNTNYRNDDFLLYDYSYAIIGFNGMKYGNDKQAYTYGPTFDSGDTIGVHLNMNDKTLSFSKNDQDLGIAFDETELISSNYRLAVSMIYPFDKIECIEHQIQNVPTTYPTLSPTSNPTFTLAPTSDQSLTLSPTSDQTESPNNHTTENTDNESESESINSAKYKTKKTEQSTINVILYSIFGVCAAICCLGIIMAVSRRQVSIKEYRETAQQADIELSTDSVSLEAKDDDKDRSQIKPMESMMRVYTLEEEFQMQPNLGV